MRTGRAGYTLAEALVALVLLAVVLEAVWGVTAVHVRGAYRLFERAEMIEASRVAGWVLRNELRRGIPGQDWAAGEDSVSIRAVRALGTTCIEASAPGALVVEVHGMRAPDLDKDSVLVLWPDGRWRAHDLVGVGEGPECGGGPVQRWTLDSREAGGLLVRLFERGSYHVSDGALRYRRGLGGRQPLTPRILAPESGLEWDAGSVALDLVPRRDPASGWRTRQRLWVMGRVP